MFSNSTSFTMYNKHFFLLLVFVVAGLGSLEARQQPEKDSTKMVMNSYFGFILRPIDFGAYNAQANALGYPSFPSELGGFTLNFRTQKEGKRLSGLSSFSFFSPFSSSNNGVFTSSFRGFGFHFALGYDLIQTAKVRLYPTVGVGFVYLVLQNSPNANLATLYGGNPPRGNQLASWQANPMVQLNVDWKIGKKWGLNAAAGYSIPDFTASWRNGAAKIDGFPTLNLNGIYSQIGMVFYP